MDVEIPLEGDMVDESAWQECSGSNVSALRAMEYLEQNVSAQLADDHGHATPTHKAHSTPR